MSKNMVERVARGIRQGRFERNGRGAAYDPDVPLHETEIADARAAIEAMREPTEEMRQAGYVESAFRTPEAFRAARLDFAPKEAWRAMITAALKP